MANAGLLVGCAILVTGTYLIRFLGVRTSPTRFTGETNRLTDQAIAVLLGSVAVATTVYDGRFSPIGHAPLACSRGASAQQFDCRCWSLLWRREG